MNDIESAKEVSKHEPEESSVKHPVVQANVPLETHDTLMNVVKLPAVFVLKTFVLIWSHRGDLVHHLSSLTHQVFSLASHLRPYFDFLMEHFIKILQGGLHNVEVAWSKIAPVLQKELLLEMEGGEFKSAESAKQSWEKQGELYKNQWKKLVKFTSNARKGSKAGKENISRRKSMKMKSAQ